MINNHFFLKIIIPTLILNSVNAACSDRPALRDFITRSRLYKSQSRPQSASPEIKSPTLSHYIAELSEQERFQRISTLTPLSPKSRPDTPSIIAELATPKKQVGATSMEHEIECKSTECSPQPLKPWNIWESATIIEPISPTTAPTLKFNCPAMHLPKITKVLVSESDNTVRPRFASNFAKLQILAQHNKPLNKEGIKALIGACIPFTKPSPEANKLEQEILGQRLCAIAETQSRLCPEPNPLTLIDDLNQLGKQLIRLGRS